MKKHAYVLFVLVIILAMVASCSPTTPATTAPEATKAPETQPTAAAPAAEATKAPEAPAEATKPAEEVKYKDTLIYATPSDQNWMDGQMNNTNDKVLRIVYSALVIRNSKAEIVPDAAEKWEVSDDGLTWTFTLKKGVKFHSGSELTTKDIKASYDRLLNTEKPVRYTGIVGFIKEIKVVDDYTFEMITEVPYPNLLSLLTHRAHLILNADTIEKYGEELGKTAETVNGTGPFKLAKWDVGEQQVYERFDDYFGEKAVSKEIIIKIVPDTSARGVAIETGEVDLADGVSQVDMDRLESVDGIAVRYFPSIGMHGLQFNCADQYLKDVRLRQAVSYGIDRETIVNALYNIEAGEKPSTAPVSPLVYGYYDFGVIKQDKEKAKALMAEAGYPDGFPIHIQVYSYVKALETVEMMAAQLAEIGITVTIEQVDNATFNSSFGSRKAPGEDFRWGMFFMGYGPSSVDAGDLSRTFKTSPDGNNNNNYGWYSNAKFDELITAVATEMDDTKRKEMLKEAMQIIYIDDPSAIYTNDRVLAYVMKDTVVGFDVNVNNSIVWAKLGILDK